MFELWISLNMSVSAKHISRIFEIMNHVQSFWCPVVASWPPRPCNAGLAEVVEATVEPSTWTKYRQLWWTLWGHLKPQKFPWNIIQREYREVFFSEQRGIKRRDGSKQTKAGSMATKLQLIFWIYTVVVTHVVSVQCPAWEVSNSNAQATLSCRPGQAI